MVFVDFGAFDILKHCKSSSLPEFSFYIAHMLEEKSKQWLGKVHVLLDLKLWLARLKLSPTFLWQPVVLFLLIFHKAPLNGFLD